MFSIVTVASSTRMPTASARPPRVMMLMVSPSAQSSKIEDRIDSGIETAMMQRAAPIAEKQQNQRRRQAGRDHRLAEHAS